MCLLLTSDLNVQLLFALCQKQTGSKLELQLLWWEAKIPNEF